MTAAKSTSAAIATILLFPRRTIQGRSVIVLMPAVLDPFNDVPSGVVKSERVRRKRAYGGGLFAVLLAAATSTIGEGLLHFVPQPIFRPGSRARSVFPLGLGRQPVAFAGLSR